MASPSKEARQKAAIERLEKHLLNHKANHAEDFTNGRFDEKSWPAHDKAQRAELSFIKGN